VRGMNAMTSYLMWVIDEHRKRLGRRRLRRRANSLEHAGVPRALFGIGDGDNNSQGRSSWQFEERRCVRGMGWTSAMWCPPLRIPCGAKRLVSTAPATIPV
jgi:hypothetical protein